MPIDEPDDRPGPPFISTLTPIEPREFEPTFASGELVFGRYEVVRMLGKGGMGIVYLVRDRKNNNAERSLKMILPNQVDERSRKRLQREANALARLNHPHIVNLIDSDFESASHPHIVMEFVKGTPLNEILREGAPMPLDWAARILEQLCDALKAAHGLDPPIIHRDLKPHNIMLLSGRSVGREFLKVLDFGLAKEKPLGGWDSPLRSIDGGLTPAYASPEQCVPERPQDQRSDIYTVGVILYEILTGHRPFWGSTSEVLEKHEVERPPAFRARNPETRVPPEVEAVVFRCLEKDPNRRPQTAEELLNEFVRAVARAGAPARVDSTTVLAKQPLPIEKRPGRRWPRWKPLAALGGSVFIMAILFASFRGIWSPVSAADNETVLAKILSDIRAQSPADRPFQRYFSLNHVDAAGALPATMDLDRKALTDAVNLVSAGSNPVTPTPIDANETIFRVDLRMLGWDEKPFQVLEADTPTKPSSLNRFDLILLEYPYAVVPKYSESFDRLSDEFLTPAAQVRPVVFVRADWFVAMVTKPPLMQDLRGTWDDRSEASRKSPPSQPPIPATVAHAGQVYLEKPVTLAIAAAELGIKDLNALRHIFSSARCVQAGLSALAKGGSIERTTWEAGFPIAVSLAETGQAIPPLEGVLQLDVASVDRDLQLELTTNKPGNVFNPGDSMIVYAKNDSAQNLYAELFVTKINGRVETLPDGPVLIAAGEKYQFPAQDSDPLTVSEMTGKERITAFARAGKFLAGSVFRGSGTSDRFVHAEWRDGLSGLKIMNAFAVTKKSMELETRPK